MSYTKYYQPISSNHWLVLQQIKTSYRDNADECQKLINDVVCDVGDEVSTEINSTIVGTSGRIYRFSRASNSNNLELTLKDLDSNGESYINDDVISLNDFFNKGFDYFADLSLNDTGITISNIISDIASASSFSTSIADVTNAFQASHSLSLPDINNILINASGDMYNVDINNLKSLLSRVIHDGKISNYAWMSIVSKLLQTAEDSLDDGETLLDTSKPFVIQSILSYVMLNLASTVLSVVAVALRGIIGAIALAVSGIVSVVSQIIAKVNSAVTDITIHPTSDTDWVNGPLWYSITDLSNVPSGYTSYLPDLTMDDGVVLSIYGPFQIVSWNGGFGKIYHNAFLTNSWNWIKVLKYICGSEPSIFEGYTNDAQPNQALIIPVSDLNYLISDKEFYFNYEENQDIFTSSRKVAYSISVAYSIFSALYHTIPYTDDQVIFSIWAARKYSDNTDHFVTSGVTDCWIPGAQLFISDAREQGSLMLLDAFRHIHTYNGSLSDFDNLLEEVESFSQTTYGYIIDGLQNIYSLANNTEASKSSGVTRISQSSSWKIVTVPGFAETYPTYYRYCSAGNFSMGATLFHYVSQSVYSSLIRFEVDAIPTSRAIDIPAISYNDLISAIIEAGVIVAAVSAVGLVASKMVKKRQFMKKSQRARDLNKLKSDYDDNPTSENAEALYKATKKYNFKAKLFGWNTYDAANGWFDSADSSSVSTVNSLLTPEGITSAASVLTSTLTPTGSTSQVNIADNINDVIHLIVGV